MAKSGRLVSALNGAVAGGMIAVLAAVALVVKPPAPPGIAEFAPQASKPITKAPAAQAAASGEGPAVGTGCAAGQTCAPTPTKRPSTPPSSAGPKTGSTPGPPAGVPSSLQCYTWPDGSVTQTFDPQSPPCIAAWLEADKGNGGATTAGVTATEIRIAVPDLGRWSAKIDERLRALERFFNSHFQFYGRKLRFMPKPPTTASGPSGGKAAAEAVAETEPFAALDITHWGDASVYRRNLVNKKIITTTIAAASLTRGELLQSRPYLWQFGPTLEELQQGFVEFACKNLRGKASYAGPDISQKPRRIAVVRRDDPDAPDIPHDILVRGLAACTGQQPRPVDYADPEMSSTQCGTRQHKATSQVVDQLKNRWGVTTVVVLGAALYCLQSAASAEAYQPEWAIVPVDYEDYAEIGIEAQPRDQTAHTFGIASSNKWLRQVDEPAYQAVATMAPNNTEWGGVGVRILRPIYQQLLMLASGIQMAGPRLTPQSFAEALEETRFPNPGAGGPKSYQASVSFGPGDHTFVDDLGVWWWSNLVDDASQSTSGTGGFCYVQKGRRWLPGPWPSNLRLQDQKTCR